MLTSLHKQPYSSDQQQSQEKKSSSQKFQQHISELISTKRSRRLCRRRIIPQAPCPPPDQTWRSTLLDMFTILLFAGSGIMLAAVQEDLEIMHRPQAYLRDLSWDSHFFKNWVNQSVVSTVSSWRMSPTDTEAETSDWNDLIMASLFFMDDGAPSPVLYTGMTPPNSLARAKKSSSKLSHENGRETWISHLLQTLEHGSWN